MERIMLDRFGREVVCTYRGEAYRVRDNGAVRRLQREGRRRRPLDEAWTFGNSSKSTGYMHMATATVHRIVATAFHGIPPTKSHVVDHVDTNRRNNRPENLRWVTRLENLLLNPITAKRIEAAYGSIEAFLDDPSSPLENMLSQDFEWMRTVSSKEASVSRERLLAWASSEGMPSGGTLAEWIFRPSVTVETPTEPENPVVQSDTPGAVQRKWRVPAKFPNCPGNTSEGALTEYRERLQNGAVFAVTPFGQSTAVSAEISQTGDALIVHCSHEDSVKNWSAAKVTIELGCFVHQSLGTFFTFEGAQKEFTLARGLTWEGGDTFDDYC